MSRSIYARLALRFDRDAVLSRREMLGASIAAASALLLAPGALGARRRGSGRRVVVIGAGFAGLAAAHEMLGAGHDVTVLEGRQRIGGRVLSFRDMVPGKIVEGGGELIGANHPAWLGYAKKFGLTMRDVTEEEGDFPVVLGGEMLSAAEAESLWEEMESTAAGLNELARRVDPGAPWDAPDALELDLQSIGRWIEEQGCGARCKAALGTLLTADNGAEAADQSLLANLAMIAGGGFESFWTDSEVYRCAEGNQALAHKLAEAIGAERIRFGRVVDRIEHGEDGARVGCGGDVIECDEVVLATPPAVWKSIRVEPPFDKEITARMGENTKHLTVLDRPVWRESGRSPDSLADGPIQLTWHETDNQEREDERRVVLTSFAGGGATAALRELAPGAREVAIGRHLESLYPGVSRATLQTRNMDWPGERFTGGSYSFPGIGQLTSSGLALRNGIGRLRFAGEHCCPAFVGYMEGALESGIAAARRVEEGVGAATR